MFGNNPINSHKPMITGSPSMNVGSADLSGVDKADKTGKKGGIGENVRQERTEPRRPGRRAGFKETLKTGAKLMFATVKALSIIKKEGLKEGVSFLADQFKNILGRSTSMPGSPKASETMSPQSDAKVGNTSDAPQIAPTNLLGSKADDYAAQAKELTGKLDTITPDLLTKDPANKEAANKLADLVLNAGKTYGELLAVDKDKAAEFRKDMLLVFDKVGECQAELGRTKLETALENDSSAKKKDLPSPGAFKNFNASFLRSNGIDDQGLSKMAGFLSAKYEKEANSIVDAFKKDKGVAKFAGNAQDARFWNGEVKAKPGYAWVRVENEKPLFGNKEGPRSKEKEVPIDKLFPKEAKEAFTKHYTNMVKTMLNPDFLDDDVAAVLGNRYYAVKNEILKGLEGNDEMSKEEKNALAEKFATASIINEVGLRFSNPAVFTSAGKSNNPMAMGLPKTLQIQINVFSQNGIETSIPEAEEKLRNLEGKFYPVHELGMDQLPLVQEQLEAIIGKCLRLAG